MLEETNVDIGKAFFFESRRHGGDVRLDTLIQQIDQLLWELEGLNLQDRPTVPDELLPRITTVVAEATEVGPVPTSEVRETVLALDRLFEAQGRLTKLKCQRRGFVILDGEDGDEPQDPPWIGRRRQR